MRKALVMSLVLAVLPCLVALQHHVLAVSTAHEQANRRMLTVKGWTTVRYLHAQGLALRAIAGDVIKVAQRWESWVLR